MILVGVAGMGRTVNVEALVGLYNNLEK